MPRATSDKPTTSAPEPRRGPRRSPTEDSKNRIALLDAAALLMLDEGYAAVTARRVAAKAGLKPQLVHYYFSSMDDLLVSLLRRGAAAGLEQQQRALASPQPLRALWAWNSDPIVTRVATEFGALAHHRQAIRAEIAAIAKQLRTAQIDAVSRALERYGVDPDEFPASVVVVLMTGTARVMVMEQAIGNAIGHDDTLEFVERYLTRLEGEAQPMPPELTGPPLRPRENS